MLRFNFDNFLRDLSQSLRENTSDSSIDPSSSVTGPLGGLITRMDNHNNQLSTNTGEAPYSHFINNAVAHFSNKELIRKNCTIDTDKDLYHTLWNKYASNIEIMIFDNCKFTAQLTSNEWSGRKFKPTKLKEIIFKDIYSEDGDIGKHIINLLSHPIVQENVKKITLENIQLNNLYSENLNTSTGDQILELINNYFNLDELKINDCNGITDISYHLNNMYPTTTECSADSVPAANNIKEFDSTKSSILEENFTTTEHCQVDFVNMIINIVKSNSVSDFDKNMILQTLTSKEISAEDVEHIYVIASNNPYISQDFKNVIKSYHENYVANNLTSNVSTIPKSINSMGEEEFSAVKELINFANKESIELAIEIIANNGNLSAPQFEYINLFCQNANNIFNDSNSLQIINELKLIANNHFHEDSLN